MDIRSVIDARESLQRRLDRTRTEYAAAQRSLTSSRGQARLSRLAKEIERIEKGIDRLNNIATNMSEGGRG